VSVIVSVIDMKGSKADLGSLGIGAYLWNPPLPTIIAEWAALIPLIMHLASSQSEYHMIGQAALEGRIATGLFPKLGHLDGIAKFLNGGSNFLERASNRSGLNSIVWDISWGSVFPCANGAAREIVTDYALRNVRPVVNVEDWTRKAETAKGSRLLTATSGFADIGEEKHISAVTSISTPRPKIGVTVRPLSHPKLDLKSKQGFQRTQTLHIIEMTRGSTSMSWRSKLDLIVESKPADVLYVLLLLALAIPLWLFGAYGTGSIVLSRITSRIACHCIPIERPLGYLFNNEAHEACMLTAVHENATTWCLYRGDRAVVDWLLNKPMISIRPSKTTLYYYFRFSHCFQILAMTYVAAQKGWDGMCLFLLMLAVGIIYWAFGRHRSVEEWLRKEHIRFSAYSFELAGRTPMIGAIQLLGNDNNSSRNSDPPRPRCTAWMDGILAPCLRRDIWMQKLLANAKNPETDAKDCEVLSAGDNRWVENHTRWARQAAYCIRTEIERADKTGA
jgi:hypothetical protein